MAEERIDIEVTDKVDGNVEKKILGIANASDKGFSAVQKLKSALADINVSAVQKLAAASNSTTNALARELTAQAKLTDARSRAAVADAKAATEQQRLATEIARTEAAQARAAAAQARAEQATARAAQAAQRAAGSTSDLSNRANALRASLDPLVAAQQRFDRELAEAKTLLAANAINIRTYTEAVAQASGRLETARGGLDRLNQTAGRGKAQYANILAQVNDLGVQFSMAAASSKPLQGVFMALIQQGSQLSYIASTMEGGWAGIAKTIGGLVLRFAPLIAAIGVVYGVLKTLQSEFNKTEPIDGYVKSLGLTEKEMKKLGDTSITTTDMVKAFFQTFMEMTGLDKVTADVSSFFKDAWDGALWFIRMAFVGFYGLVVGGMKSVAEIIMKLPTVAGATAKAIANAVIAAVEWMINKAADGINALAAPVREGLAKVGFDIGEIGHVAFGRFTMSAEDSANTVSAIVNRNVTGSILEADATLTRFGQNWRKNADAIRRTRLRTKANEIIADRTEKKGPKPKEDHTAENRAKALANVNLQLDNELERMKMLKPEREIQQRYDQIEQELARKGITLSASETAAIREKIKAVEDYKYVQQEMDRIYEEVTGPQRTYNATIAAATDLLNRHVISQEQFNAEQLKASRILAEANDPLFALKEGMTQAEAAAKLYGDAVEQNNYYEQLRQAYLAKGIDITNTSSQAIKDEVAAMMARNQALLQQQYIQSTIGEIVNPILADQKMLESKQALYAEIDRLRQTDVLNEEQAQRAKLALDMKFSQQRLQAQSDFFGALASVTQQGHGVIGAISKAAAVAQATIDGYVAVQKALASAPPPWNYIAAAAVAIKTGAQVAGILSTNVGSFATGGQFMVDGRAGVDANNINMNVTRGERVTIETPAQQRANDAAGTGAVAQGDVKIINQFDEREFISAMDSDAGERIILNVIKRNPNAIKSANG